MSDEQYQVSNPGLKRDYYEILGITPSASPEEIRNAYRSLAQRHHPDLAGDDSDEMFILIGEAYETLKDPEKRNEYNRERGYGHFESVELHGIGGEPKVETSDAIRGPRSVSIAEEHITTSSTYNKMEEFGEGLGLKVAQRAALSGEQVAHEEEPEVSAWGEAETAKGIRSKLFGKGTATKRSLLKQTLKERMSDDVERADYRKTVKPTRPLSAQEVEKQRDDKFKNLGSTFRDERIFAFQISKLESILGTKRTLALPGKDGEPRKNDVLIPPGAKDQQVIEIAWGWERAKIRISVVRDPVLDIIGRNFLLRLPVTIEEAIEGGAFTVPTVDGPRSVDLPPMVDPIEGFLLSEKGLQLDPLFPPGDLVISPRITPPQGDSPTLSAASEALEACYLGDVREELNGDEEGDLYYWDGDNLCIELPLTFGEARHGVSLKVPTPLGEIQVDVPGPWDPEVLIHLVGKGRESILGGRGDVFVFPFVRLPDDLSGEVLAAAKAISHHHMTPVRKNIPKKIGPQTI
jgi:DnaJ-class molecular chaperone